MARVLFDIPYPVERAETSRERAARRPKGRGRLRVLGIILAQLVKLAPITLFLP